MIKPYRYLIATLLSWAYKRDNSPEFKIFLYLMFLHFAQLLILGGIISWVYEPAKVIFMMNKPVVLGFLAIYGTLIYLLIRRNKDWSKYMDEFKQLDKKQKVTCHVLTGLYVATTLVLLFAVPVWVFG